MELCDLVTAEEDRTHKRQRRSRDGDFSELVKKTLAKQSAEQGWKKLRLAVPDLHQELVQFSVHTLSLFLRVALSRTTKLRPTPSLPHRLTLTITEIAHTAFGFSQSTFFKVIWIRVPGYQRSSVSTYNPVELISRMVCATETPPFQKYAVIPPSAARADFLGSRGSGFKNSYSQLFGLPPFFFHGSSSTARGDAFCLSLGRSSASSNAESGASCTFAASIEPGNR